jgi:predicted DCC family thiol-disulfide oxidoreductase YuxK
MYRKLPSRTRLEWIDVSVPDYYPPSGVTQLDLMRRFHARTSDGQLTSGARAFVHVWAQLPGWRHLARIALIPGMVQILEAGYRIFLVFRPWMQRIYRRWHQR